MGKHHDKVAKALDIRIKTAPNDRGYRKPGSMNPHKTGKARTK